MRTKKPHRKPSMHQTKGKKAAFQAVRLQKLTALQKAERRQRPASRTPQVWLRPYAALANRSAPAFARLFCRNKSPCRMEQIPQDVAVDPGQSHQYNRIVHVMIRDVVDVWRFGNQCVSLIEINPYTQGVWFGGFIDRRACQQLAANFQRRGTVSRTLLHTRQLGCNFSHCVEGDFVGRSLHCVLQLSTSVTWRGIVHRNRKNRERRRVKCRYAIFF